MPLSLMAGLTSAFPSQFARLTNQYRLSPSTVIRAEQFTFFVNCGVEGPAVAFWELPGSVPACLGYALCMREGSYFTYIVASRSHPIYVGMTGDLNKRVFEHKDGTYKGFTSRYNCNRLVWFESFDDSSKAIGREKQLKGWRREKKIALIERANPTWRDLSQDWYDIDPSLERKYMADAEE